MPARELRNDRGEPVADQRLVEVRLAIDARMQPVARHEHFADDLEPAGFRADAGVDAEAEEQHAAGEHPEGDPFRISAHFGNQRVAALLTPH